MAGKMKWLSTITIVALLCSLCVSQDVTKISLNTLKEYSIKSAKGGKAYFTATVEEKEEGDLIVQLNNLSIDGDPDLSVFINLDTKPTSKTQPYCTSDQIGYDVCLINSEHIKQDLKILIEVSCQTECKYSLNLIYKDKIEYNTEDGGKIDVIFKEAEVREFLVKIPRSKKPPTNMLIEAEFKNMNSLEYEEIKDFQLFGDKGSKTPTNVLNAKLHSIWINDNIRAIPLSETNLCNDCYFSIAIKAPKYAIIQFSAVAYDNERDLDLSSQFSNGVVLKNEIQYLTIDFDELLDYERERIFTGTNRNQIFAANFLFDLIPYNGDPNLYIHYGPKRPESLDKFQWQSISQFRQDIILVSSDELNKIGYSSKNKIFIAVHGVEVSAYQLRIDIYSESYNNSNIDLQHAQPVTGFVGKRKLTNYSFRVEGNQKRTIEIQLTSLVGNPDLFVKKWRYGDGGEQLIQDEDIKEFFRDMNSKNHPFIGWSINKQGLDTVKVQYDPKECMSQNELDGGNNKKIRPNYDIMYFNYCVFQIGVYGNEENNKYILKTISNEPESIQPIRENYREFAYLDQLDSKYFSFKPMSLDTQIDSIRFLLHFTSGYASITGDRDLEKLKANKPEKDYLTSANNHYIEYKKEDLKRNEKLCDFTYFIQVKALERTVAVVNIEITRNGQKSVTYETLVMGYPTKIVLQPKQSGYFQFSQSYGVDQTIIARSDHSFKMYIGNYTNILPTAENNKYDADKNIYSYNNFKRIDIEKEVETEGYLFTGTIENISDKEITVIVNGRQEMINIDINQTHEDILLPSVKSVYYFNIFNEVANEKIYVYVIPSGTVLQQKVKGAYMINKNLVGTFQENDLVKYFEVDQTLLKRECPFLFQENVWQDCLFQIEVESTQEEKIFVSVNVPQRPSYIQYYGATISQFPLQGETRKFLYYIYGTKEFILTVQSYSYEFQVLGKIVTYQQFYNKNAMNGNFFPTLEDEAKKISIYSDPNIIHQIRFQPETYKGESCDNGCFLMISVLQPKYSEIKDDEALGNIIKLNISGDKIYDLQLGESITGEVQNEEMIYYRIFVPAEMNNQRLIINLTPLDNGDPDIFLNKDAVKLPTRTEFHLGSQDTAGDFILVEKDSIKGEKGIAGYYIVGVYGGSKATYTIQYQAGPHAIYKIYKDSIQQVSLTQKSSMAYFVYYKKEKGFFTIVTNMSQGSAGDAYLFIKQYNNKNGKVRDFLDKLTNPNEADFTTKHSAHKEYLRYDKNDCDDCTYIIGVKADRSVQFSISLTLDDGVTPIQNNKQSLLFVREKIPSKLNFFSQTDFNLYVTAYSGHCIEVRVNYGYAALKKTILTKECQSDLDKTPQGYDSFHIFVKHPDIEAANSGGGLYYASLFNIELKSTYGEEKVVIQGVSGKEARLITAGIPVEQEIDPASSKMIQFLYQSSHESLQSVQVQISAEPGNEDCLTFLEQEMKIQDSSRSVTTHTISNTKLLIANSYLTEKDLPYILQVNYSGKKKFKFTVLLKETNRQSIPILSGYIVDVLPTADVSNYVVPVKKEQNVLIQNFNCASDQNMFVYTNVTDLIAQNSNAERVTKRSTSNHEIQIMNIADKNYEEIYIQKRANKNTKHKYSTSLITAEVFAKSDPIIYNYIQIGDSGIISSQQNADFVEVYFLDIECISAECERVKGLLITSIEYTLHIATNREDLQRITNCLIRQETDLALNDKIEPLKIYGFSALMKQEQRKIAFKKSDIPQNAERLYISLSANVETDGRPGLKGSYRFIYGTMVYDNIINQEQEQIESSSSNLAFIIGICVVSIFILLLVVVQLYRRYKNVNDRLKYEMHDVRNVAHSDIESDNVPTGNQFNSILSNKGHSQMIEMK